MDEIRASYTDTFEHSFDAKGRITVPSEWREAPFEKSLFVLPSNDKCLRVYPASWVSELHDELRQLKTADPHRAKLENMATGAQPVSLDAQGRIMVKEKHRVRAGLKKDVTLVGRLDHFQLWDSAEWKNQEAASITVEDALSAIGR